jgi:hypothetical protein
LKACHFGNTVGFSLESLLNMIFQEDFCHRLDTCGEGHGFYKWNYERDWYWYMLWGRLAYDPNTPQEVFAVEFERRFGAAGGKSVGDLYHIGSRIVPLIYAFNHLGMDSRHITPEMEMGGNLGVTTQVTPLDANTIYRIADYVDDCLAGQASGKRTPIDVARSLREAAHGCEHVIRDADAVIPQANREWLCTKMDFRALTFLGLFYSHKILAALELQFYLKTQRRNHHELACHHLDQAIHFWRDLVWLTVEHYRPFPEFRLGMAQYGSPLGLVHWCSWLTDERLRQELDVLKAARNATPPCINHEPVTSAMAGAPLEIRAAATAESGVTWMKLHYKPVPTKYRWKEMPMAADGDGYSAAIPASEVTSEGVMYFIEAADNAQNGAIWPDARERTPYVIVDVAS